MKTALITGATEGIGYEFTKLFAQKGINLVLVARNEKRLQQIATDLSSCGIDIRIYAKDLSLLENAKYVYDDLKVNNIAVDYLINNAGFGINDKYIDIDWQREVEMFHLNMLTLAFFTKVFSKDMVTRNFGRILNIGSTGSFQPGPYMAGYCATKAFVLSLSEAVNFELKGTNVSVSTLCPGVTDTKFHAVAQTGSTMMSKLLFHASPEKVAKYGYKMMMNGKSLGIHGLSNKLLVFSNRFICRKLLVLLTGKLLKMQ
jgi:short-subunit dehydrogenase